MHALRTMNRKCFRHLWKTKNRKITLSLPEDVIKTLWILKAEKGYPSISKIVAEAVRKYAGGGGEVQSIK